MAGKAFGVQPGVTMRPAVTSALTLLLLSAPSLAMPQESSSQAAKPTFRSAVDLVSVAAVVRDKRGRFARNLRKEDFVVQEGGARREIIEFRSDENAPVRVALLFDVSGSMRVGNNIEQARAAASHVVSWLRPGLDEAAVFAFDTQLRELHPFTKDPEELKKAAAELLPPFGQTAIYDAIAAAAKRVAERANTRRGVLVLTDGVDTKSRLNAADVSAIASGIDVPVYVMAVVSPVDHPGEELADTNADTSALKGALSDLADWTGGSIFIASTPSHYSVAARRLLDELRHQYLIAFEASPSAGWRRLEIRTRDRDLIVRARSGYVAGNGNSQE